LAARFPEKARKLQGHVPSGVAALDRLLGGGLPVGQLTELVSQAPSSGGQLVLGRLIQSTRQARQRVVLIDGADGFAPEALPADALCHLVWVRCRHAADAFAAADLLVRDGNYAALALDLRGLSEKSLRQQPASTWYRLQRAADESPSAILVMTPYPLVPAVPWRLVLAAPLPLEARRWPQEKLAARLAVELVRGHAQREERAG
jgi:hypothetical protein